MTATVATDARPTATAAAAPDRDGDTDGGRSPQQRSDRHAGRILIGTQSFSHDPWVGLVYPPGLRRSDRIGHYAQAFPVVELDNTYYAIPSRGLLAGWAAQTPPGFEFTAKVPLEITQTAKLAGAAALRQLAHFLDTMRVLGDRLGPLVFQMSPGFCYPQDYPALERCLRALPDLGGEDLRFAVEFRHPSWLAAAAPEALLRAHGVAWVWNDWLPTEAYQRAMPRAIDAPAAGKVTADDFAYVRLVGDHNAPIDRRTVVIDRGRDLVRWADLVLAFRREREGRGVYVLLNNHYSGCSPQTVRELQRILGLPVVTFSEERAAAAAQPRLF